MTAYPQQPTTDTQDLASACRPMTALGSTWDAAAPECGCIACQAARRADMLHGDIRRLVMMDTHFRYACEECGNKRCPHHTDHILACTDSNAVGQKGSAWE